MVEEVRTELHGDHVARFERVPQQQVFALGVECGALYALGLPVRADFDAMMTAVHVQVRCHAGHSAGGCV